MALSKLTENLNNIQALQDRPNESDGLTADELKQRFDKAGNDIKTYINNTLTAELDTALGDRYKKSETYGKTQVDDLLDNKQKTISYGTSNPAGGSDGDIYIKYIS